jgi:hypothetical protein
LRLDAFVARLRKWADDPNTMLRGTAREALEKVGAT